MGTKNTSKMSLKDKFTKLERKNGIEDAIKKINKDITKEYGAFMDFNVKNADNQIAELICNKFDDFVDELIELTEFLISEKYEAIRNISDGKNLKKQLAKNKVVNFQEFKNHSTKKTADNHNENNEAEWQNTDDDLIFLEIYEKLALNRWIYQNSAIKKESINNQCIKITEKILQLLIDNNLAISVVKENDSISSMDFYKIGYKNEYKTEEEYNTKVSFAKEYINNLLYAAASNYKNGILFIHEELSNNNRFIEREYAFLLKNEAYIPLSTDELSCADGNQTNVEYCELF